MRSRNDMYADQFTNATCGSGARIGRGLHRAHIAAHEYGHIARADVFLAEQLHIRRFDHRVSSFDRSDEPFCLDHSQCFEGHVRESSPSKIVEVKKQIDYASSYHRDVQESREVKLEILSL